MVEFESSTQIAEVLEKEFEVYFILNETLCCIWWSDNGGWMYDVYHESQIVYDADGDLDMSDVEPFDGGLCTGEAIDAVSMAIGYDLSAKDEK